MTKTDKQTEEAKRQNEEAKRKQNLEKKQMQYDSPEKLRGTGEDIHPQSTVVPNTPQPENDPGYVGTRYDGNGGKGE